MEIIIAINHKNTQKITKLQAKIPKNTQNIKIILILINIQIFNILLVFLGFRRNQLKYRKNRPLQRYHK